MRVWGEGEGNRPRHRRFARRAGEAQRPRAHERELAEGAPGAQRRDALGLRRRRAGGALGRFQHFALARVDDEELVGLAVALADDLVAPDFPDLPEGVDEVGRL